MAIESKPLFHPEVIRQQVRSFNLPERVGDCFAIMRLTRVLADCSS